MEQTVTRTGFVFLPIFVRSHWIAGVLRRRNNRYVLTIHDSAPSQLVHTDILTSLKRWPDIILEQGTSPQQQRYSEDCGIFMLLAFFCIAAGWTVSHTNGLSKQLRQLFANPPMDKEQFFVALKRIINPDVQGGSRFNPISHADIRRRIRALWADGCQKLQVTCTWEGQLENLTRIRPKTWKGYINRPVRDADKGPWNTIWTHTHRAQDSGSFYEELTPNEDITYYEFDVIPFPDSSLREQRIAAVRAVARGDNNVPTTGNGHAHSNDKVTDADTENERDESDSDV